MSTSQERFEQWQRDHGVKADQTGERRGRRATSPYGTKTPTTYALTAHAKDTLAMLATLHGYMHSNSRGNVSAFLEAIADGVLKIHV